MRWPGEPFVNFDNLGFWGIALLLLDIWAILNIAQSTTETFKKAVWIVLVLVLPLLGFVAWLLMGPRSARSR